MNEDQLKQDAAKVGTGATAAATKVWSWGSTHMNIAVPILTFVAGYLICWFTH